LSFMLRIVLAERDPCPRRLHEALRDPMGRRRP
jgi:hypothetical protein